MKIADLRHSGKQDLVVADGAEGMAVLLNNGDGTFGKATIYPPTCQNCVAPSACVVADFNLDGRLDVACATSIDDSYLFYGDGKGKFGSSIPIHDAINFQGGFSIAAGDFNNDKAPDLAIPIQIKGKVGGFFVVGEVTGSDEALCKWMASWVEIDSRILPSFKSTTPSISRAASPSPPVTSTTTKPPT